MALSAAEEAQTRALIAQEAPLLSLASSEPSIISNLGATDVSLSSLGAAASLGDTDLLLVRQGVTDKSITGLIVKNAAAVVSASETVQGKVELATAAETITGTDNTRAVHPAGLLAALLNGGAKQIQALGATVAASALTFTFAPASLDFRSSTLSSGVINKRTIGTTLSLVVSSGSTLGTISGQAARIALLAIDNAGTVELAVVNLAGGNNLDETTLISTTAEGGAGAADSANVIYSQTARTNVPFRVLGFIDITEATAGTWATAPSTIQGSGGQALAAFASFGYGQTWQSVVGSRALSTTYYNTTGKSIFISVKVITSSGNQDLSVSINGGAAISFGSIGAITGNMTGVGIIPPGASYNVTAAGSLSGWWELR